MKKIIIVLATIAMSFPLYVKAESNDLSVTVNEVTKYYKTIIIKNNNSMYSINNQTINLTYEITEEEYNNSNESNNIYAITETEYKKMTTTISQNGSYYRYKVKLEWKLNPFIRSYDVIAIGHYETVRPHSSIYFEQKYCTSTTNCTTNTNGNIKTTSTGTGVTFELQSGNYTSITQTLYFDVEKNTNHTIIRQKAAGDYSHATSYINQSIADTFTIDDTQINFPSTNLQYFDSINSATATWNGNW